MNNLTEITPSDLIIQHMQPRYVGGWSIGNSTGIKLYHKPSNITIEMDIHRGQHRNRHEAVIVLQDLLTEFQEGDIIVCSDGLGEVTGVGGDDRGMYCSYLVEDGTGRLEGSEKIAHTEEGYRYKSVQLKEKQITKLREKIREAEKEIRLLEGGV